MRENLTNNLKRYTGTFAAFTPGQKAVALIGTAALLIGGFLVVRWAGAPTYAPLYSGLSGEDAAAVVEELDKQGVTYELTNGGTTVMVPQSEVYASRIALSGEGLPATSDSGYALLDGQDLSTSEFKEQTDFKRAMEGELSTTIEAIDGVETAVVHLALPKKQVFTEEQDPPTASVLVKTGVGDSISGDQVQAIVHLIASSIDGLDPKNVTVADATGKVLTLQDDTAAGAASTRQQQVDQFQTDMQSKIQSVLDRVVGAGNSTVNVTADLDFDAATTTTRRYIYDPAVPPLSETTTTEKYNGPGNGTNGAVGGVVGPDGQMDPTAGAGDAEATYENGTTTKDNAVGRTEEHREAAPGGVKSLHIGVVLDSGTVGTIQPEDMRDVIAAATGIDTARGDTIDVSTMPFDRSTESEAAEELAKAEAAEEEAAKLDLYRNIGLGSVIALVLLLAWIKARRRAKAREEATSYVVEQLRNDAAARAQAQELAAAQAVPELEIPLPNPADDIREELNALVERQPEDVAALLRGWLVER